MKFHVKSEKLKYMLMNESYIGSWRINELIYIKRIKELWLIQLSSISFNLTIHKPKFNNIHKQKQGRCVFAGNVTIIRTKMKEKKKTK